MYNKNSRILTYSSAGHPPAILYNLQDFGRFNHIFLRTESLVIGALRDSIYVNDYFQIPFDNRLFLYSDSAYELKNSKNQMTTFDDFTEILDQYVSEYYIDLDKIVLAAQKLQDGENAFADDFSIIEFIFH